MSITEADRILRSRKELMDGMPALKRADEAAEGGCGVLGFAANLPVPGRHVLAASRQMHNRGNGKGGGIAMVGLDPSQARVDRATLRSHYLLQVALLEPQARAEIESQFIRPCFEVAQAYELGHLDDYRKISGLEVRPPDVWRYFVRVKSAELEKFAQEKGLVGLPQRSVEDEFVYQNSYRLNRHFYASLGDKRAFVLSHGHNLSVLKIVGYAEDVVAYYGLEDQTAHVWIAHQRYPTKGRVWHPGGAHPFIGLNEALVHNGDFANYHAVSEYLRQRNIGQLFLTDTEVSVQLFDLWDRLYRYPLEITLEAMAPTSEFDFEMLPEQKKILYRAVQRAHIHGSPDGPWFFIVARSRTEDSIGEDNLAGPERFELIGITDTSMLRPQVFALYENLETSQPVQIGMIASERQAINACLRSLSAEDIRFQPNADRYWVARGGSRTDGGVFRFSVSADTTQTGGGVPRLICENKFGQPVTLAGNQRQLNPAQLDPQHASGSFQADWRAAQYRAYDNGGAPSFFNWLVPEIPAITWDELAWGINCLSEFARSGDSEWIFALDALSLVRDRRYPTGDKKRASLLRLVDQGLAEIFTAAPLLEPETAVVRPWVDQNIRLNPAALSLLPESALAMGLQGVGRLTWETRHALRSPKNLDELATSLPDESSTASILVIDALGFPPEGEQAVARWIVAAYKSGWRRIAVYNWRGGRFAGCGLGPDSTGLQIDLFGDVGDYTASGLDGAAITLHGDGQDQLGQIMKSGRLVIHGDAGQTFLYGAKGGEVYVSGSVAGRPLINAVGRPRVVINGTCLDYLAESFMAGDPLNGGGFVILNGVNFVESGLLHELETPYPGGNLFSLASGGAIYLRDPHRRVFADQLNGGVFAPLSQNDWDLIEPYLRQNEQLFGIRVDDLLTVDGQRQSPADVYRKVAVQGASVLNDEQNR